MTTKLAGGVIDTPGGGKLDIPRDNALEYPGHTIQRPERGVAFGPLELTPYPETTSTVGGLTYKEETTILDPDSWFGNDGDGGLLAAGGAVALSTRPPPESDGTDDQLAVGRRELLKTLAASTAVLGGATAVGRAAEATKTVTRFSLPENPGGVRLRLIDTAPDVMPEGDVYRAFANGIQYDHVGVGSGQYGDQKSVV